MWSGREEERVIPPKEVSETAQGQCGEPPPSHVGQIYIRMWADHRQGRSKLWADHRQGQDKLQVLRQVLPAQGQVLPAQGQTGQYTTGSWSSRRAGGKNLKTL